MSKKSNLFLSVTRFIIFIVLAGVGLNCGGKEKPVDDIKSKSKMVFASFAESDEQLRHIFYLAESLRKFGGDLKDAPVWVYVSDYIDVPMENIKQRFVAIDNVEIEQHNPPEQSRKFFYAGKTFAAGAAEQKALGRANILVWMDDDTVVLKEPVDFILDDSISFAYRPVMHNRSGTLYGKKPNPFWKEIYRVLKIDDSSHFKMIAAADKEEINPYFNSGLLVVRPEKGILGKWGTEFKKLYRDSVLYDMCKENIEHRIFLHQTALVGAVLHSLNRNEMTELSSRYNYPLFFDRMFEAAGTFESLDGIITMRYESFFREPIEGWEKLLKGNDEIIGWLRKRLTREAEARN